MKRSRSFYVLPAVFLILLGTVLGMQIEQVITGDDALASLQKLEDAFFTINRHYVDDVDAGDEVEHAIQGMLEHLDPHSSYISASEIQEVRESYQGSFGGIGIWYEVPDDTARVISTISEGPSEKVGLLPGDRIVAVDGAPVLGDDSDGITKRLKGEIGTKVEVTVVRPGVREPLDFTITRDRIPLYTVDTAYMLDDQTGFIKVSRFAATTYDEFVEAVGTLRGEGMQRLVLDLRDNPGGVMEAAVQMVDELLSGGHTIVYTQGRADVDQTYRSTARGTFEAEPVIVLVNPYSASASEIMAGALQDHDRALIVGQRTFGKGLVQQQFPLADGSVLQMTVSRYYTPSGRLIQTPYTDGNLENYYKQKFASLEESVYDVSHYLDTIPDSLKYETTHGRTVFGGGGIMPDFVVAPDTVSAFGAYAGRREIFDFAHTYFSGHEAALRDQWTDRADAYVSSYAVDDAMWNDFVAYLDEHVEADDADAAHFAPAGLAENRPMLETLLKAYVGRQLYSAKAWYPIYNQIDPVLNAALRQWDQAAELVTYHAR